MKQCGKIIEIIEIMDDGAGDGQMNFKYIRNNFKTKC